MGRRKKRKEIKLVNFGTVIIIPIIAFIAIYFGFNEWTGLSTGSTNTKNIEYIASHINGQGKIVDYQNNLGAKSAEDIKLYVEGNEVTIHFGRIVLEWKMEDFVTQEVGDELKKIHITRYRDEETGKLRVFWQGEELVRYVK